MIIKEFDRKGCAERIRTVMREKGLTRKDMAEALCLSVESANHYVYQGVCFIGELIRVADFLGVSLDWLCGRTEWRWRYVYGAQWMEAEFGGDGDREGDVHGCDVQVAE